MNRCYINVVNAGIKHGTYIYPPLGVPGLIKHIICSDF